MESLILFKIAFFVICLLILVLSLWIIDQIKQRLSRKVVERKYFININGIPIHHHEVIKLKPMHKYSVSVMMIEEYENGEMRVFNINRKITLISEDDAVVKVFHHGNRFITGKYVNRTKVYVESKYERYHPISLIRNHITRNHITSFFVKVVPGEPYKVLINMEEYPYPFCDW